jgi:hypothetical protein
MKTAVIFFGSLTNRFGADFTIFSGQTNMMVPAMESLLALSKMGLWIYGMRRYSLMAKGITGEITIN